MFKEQFDKAYNVKLQQFKEMLSEEIIYEKLKPIEQKIDLMVYKLYELTFDEVRVIDQNFTLTEAEYNNYQL